MVIFFCQAYFVKKCYRIRVVVKIFNGVFENDSFKLCVPCVVGRNLTLQNFIVTTRIRQKGVVYYR